MTKSAAALLAAIAFAVGLTVGYLSTLASLGDLMAERDELAEGNRDLWARTKHLQEKLDWTLDNERVLEEELNALRRAKQAPPTPP